MWLNGQITCIGNTTIKNLIDMNLVNSDEQEFVAFSNSSYV
jgi:hypothetical protein